MKVQISIPVYACAPEGHTVLRFMHGAVVTGRAAEMALADKAGEVIGAPVLETKVTPPDEKKKRPYHRKVHP